MAAFLYTCNGADLSKSVPVLYVVSLPTEVKRKRINIYFFIRRFYPLEHHEKRGERLQSHKKIYLSWLFRFLPLL